MTNNGISNQGEGSVSGFCSPYPPEATRWIARPLFPLSCVKTEVVVHGKPGSGLWCVGYELSDPHTRELLAKGVDPSASYTQPRALCAAIALDVRQALEQLLDPDPF